jgi:hypothetical protein
MGSNYETNENFKTFVSKMMSLVKIKTIVIYSVMDEFPYPDNWEYTQPKKNEHIFTRIE